MAPNSLCSRCLATHFASLFNTPQRDVSLLTLEQLWSKVECPFCDLMKHTLTTYYGTEYMREKVADNPEMQLFVSQSPVDLRCDWNTLYREHDTGEFLLELYGKGRKGSTFERVAKKTNDEFNESWFMPKIQLFRDGESGGAHGKAVLPETVDWGYLRNWVTTCDAKHARASGTELGSLPLLFIDVDKMCVVPMPLGPVRFIALSYMWGKDQLVKLKKENCSLLTTPGAFSRSKGLALSRTIQDTIRAAELLGCRYLWIDALCVIQDDPAHLKANVGAMDKVYAGAWLTIIAAAGDNADGGLPGVYPDLPRAERQLRVEIPQKGGKPIVMGNMFDSAKAALNFSTWDTRGWTYQERVLSHRLLSFTHSQVYFYCDRGCSCREDMYPLTGPDDDDAGDTFNSGYELSFEYDDIFTIYASAVARYTQRQLTQRSDKINGFQGLLNRLSGPFLGPFVLGLPSTAFDVGLLWEPAGLCVRVSGEFPSWSWAGWDGPVRYAMKDSMANLCECVVSLVTVETSNSIRLCTKSDGGKKPPLVSADGTVWRRSVDEDTLEVYYTTSEESGAGYRYPRPLPSLNHRAVQQGDLNGALTNSNLHINGLVATFLVSDQHSSAGRTLSTCREGTHTHCHLQLLDSASQVVGYILVNGQKVPEIAGKKHRFLALSRSTLHRIDADPSWDPETTSFRPWTHPESGCPGSEDENSDDDGDGAPWMKRRREFFDEEVFNPRIFWPILNVLMLSEVRVDGAVERVGVGKVHVDGFLPVAMAEDVLLG